MPSKMGPLSEKEENKYKQGTSKENQNQKLYMTKESTMLWVIVSFLTFLSPLRLGICLLEDLKKWNSRQRHIFSQGQIQTGW